MKYVEVFFTRRRRYSTVGFKSPMQFMQDWMATQDQTKQAA